MKFQLLYIICFTIFFQSCSIAEDHKSVNNYQENSENFNEFYSKFHSDSLFQVERITFPLKGYKRTTDDDPEKIDSVYYWQKNTWEMHKNITIDSSVFKEEKVVNNNLIIHRVSIPNSGFLIERHFQLINGKWYLIYYKDIDI